MIKGYYTHKEPAGDFSFRHCGNNAIKYVYVDSQKNIIQAIQYNHNIKFVIWTVIDIERYVKNGDWVPYIDKENPFLYDILDIIDV